VGATFLLVLFVHYVVVDPELGVEKGARRADHGGELLDGL